MLFCNVQKVKYEKFGKSFRKPPFAEIIVDTGLQSQVGNDSWHFSNLLKTESSFLSSSVEQWSLNEGYLSGKMISRALKVTNDTAERDVRPTSDFLDTAPNEQRFQSVLPVVENNRNHCPNQRKSHKGSSPGKWGFFLFCSRHQHCVCSKMLH